MYALTLKMTRIPHEFRIKRSHGILDDVSQWQKATGVASTNPTTKHNPATASMNICCTRVGSLASQNAIPRLHHQQRWEQIQKIQPAYVRKRRSHPPRNKVVAPKHHDHVHVFRKE